MATGWTVETLKEHFEKLLCERDKREVEVQARIESLFTGQEKAVAKQEEAQRELNVKNNEFRGQLKDQAELQIPRTEVVGMLGAVEAKAEAGRQANAKDIDALRMDIAALRQSRDVVSGRSEGLRGGWTILLGVLATGGTLVGIVGTIIALLSKKGG